MDIKIRIRQYVAMHELKIQRIRVYIIYMFHAPKFLVHVRNHDL